MSDCEERDFFWKSWISPEKRRRKKKKKCVKTKVSMKIDKKKKKQKKEDRDVMVERNEKKKKTKKKKTAQGLDNCFFTQQKEPVEKPEPSHSSKESQKKSKKKKKVAFDLSAGHVPVKRPRFVSSSPGSSRGQAQVSDSQTASDDVNSQDLFITQKTFRPSPQQPITAQHSPEGQERSDMCLQDDLQTERGVFTKEEEEEPSLFFMQKKEDPSFQRLVESNMNLTQVRRSDPMVLSSAPLEVTDSKMWSCSSNQQSDGPSLLHHTSKSSSSTQTENFFTTELSSYLHFCQRRGATACLQDVTPLDLSLPTKTRNHQDPDQDQRPASLPRQPSSCSRVKELKKELKMEVEASCDQRKDKASSSQSESEVKSVDTTTSSEDSELPCCTGRPDLTQVRAVQTRLNESFFFKTKGDGHNHRPESPLMKLTLGRHTKSRKSR